MKKINLAEKFSGFEEQLTPKIIAESNGQLVKLAKGSGELIWHAHKNEDELFFVVKGKLTIKLRQENTELEFQGRVQSLFNSISGIFILIFYVLLGNVSHSVGLQSLYWCESLLMLLLIKVVVLKVLHLILTVILLK